MSILFSHPKKFMTVFTCVKVHIAPIHQVGKTAKWRTADADQDACCKLCPRRVLSNFCRSSMMTKWASRYGWASPEYLFWLSLTKTLRMMTGIVRR